MIKTLHPAAGALALLTVGTFWTATVWSELFGSVEAVVTVKTAIPWGFAVLIPALATAGATGFRRARSWHGRLVDAKRRRMPVIAANGLVVLIPAALFLAAKAERGEFDAAFYGVQTVELVAGAVNFVLLGLNMRDGFAMTRRFQRSSQPMRNTP